jgi:ATP-binding cassette subfamily C protein
MHIPPVPASARSDRSELHEALRAFRGAFAAVALFSGFSNILMLSGAIFMLEVYDRVIPSRSLPTLAWLIVLICVLFGFQAVIDAIRSRVLARVAGGAAEALAKRVFTVVVELPLNERSGDSMRAARALDQISAYLAGGGPVALFDLPWIPLYLAVCFGFHFWIGVTATAGALILLGLTALAETRMRRPSADAAKAATQRNAMLEAGRRNAEVLRGMGMATRFGRRWQAVNGSYLAAQLRAADVSAGFGSLSKVARIALQSAVLGVGAFLVIDQQATGGVIIAGSILSARALAPVDLAIANWRGFEAARTGWRELAAYLARLPERAMQLALPAPRIDLTVESLSVSPPGEARLSVEDVSFGARAGSAIGIVGPSAAGKSSLARALVGVWKPRAGKVRLDGAAIDQWSAEALGRNIGYLPQDVELFAGTVAENISRFEADAQPDAIIAAAIAAGIHQTILRLPNGYETEIGEGGAFLSAGQRQLVALARALYGDPFLVVLDEPNSNLDAKGEEALAEAIRGVRRRGGIVAVVSHRANIMSAVDIVLMMNEGRMQSIGPRDEVLRKILPPPAIARAGAAS